VFSSSCGLYCSAGVYRVKNYKSSVKEKQYLKIRLMLNAELTPIEDIKRPVGMKKYLWERRYKKLRRLHREIDALISEGLQKDLNRMYYL
jgi:hypothetical protein